MDVSGLLLTDQIPPGSPALVVNFAGGGTIFGGVVVRFPSEVPILVTFAGEGVEVVNEINVEGDTGSVNHVQTLQLHKSTNPITGFNVLPGDPNTAIANFSSSFLELTDTPNTYAGQSDKLVRVNAGETELEFVSPITPSAGVGNFIFFSRNPLGLVTGKIPGYWTCPFAGTISAWNLSVDAGTLTVKIWKIATGTAHPTSANSINTSGISLSSGTNVHSTTLTDFTTLAVAAHDIFAVEITAVSGVIDFGGSLEITKS